MKIRIVCSWWRRVSETNSLWKNVCLDEWPIYSLKMEHLEYIMSHAQGFRLFSLVYTKLLEHRGKLAFSAPHCLISGLSTSCDLVYVNLSGQFIKNIDFVRYTPKLEYLFINDCFMIRDISQVRYCKELAYFSFNRVMISEDEENLIQPILALPKLVLLELKDYQISLDTMRKFCNGLPKLLFLNATFSAEDLQEAKSLESQYDISMP